jgi:hypothetical protein
MIAYIEKISPLLRGDPSLCINFVRDSCLESQYAAILLDSLLLVPEPAIIWQPKRKLAAAPNQPVVAQLRKAQPKEARPRRARPRSV